MNFTVFNWLKQIFKNIFWHWLEHEIQMSVSTNAVLLDYSHTLYSVRGCFSATKAVVSSCDRDCMASKPRIFTMGSFTEKVCWALLWCQRRKSLGQQGNWGPEGWNEFFKAPHFWGAPDLPNYSSTMSSASEETQQTHWKDLHKLEVTWGTDLEREICTHPSDLAKPRKFLIAPVKWKKKKKVMFFLETLSLGLWSEWLRHHIRAHFHFIPGEACSRHSRSWGRTPALNLSSVETKSRSAFTGS